MFLKFVYLVINALLAFVETCIFILLLSYLFIYLCMHLAWELGVEHSPTHATHESCYNAIPVACRKFEKWKE